MSDEHEPDWQEVARLASEARETLDEAMVEATGKSNWWEATAPEQDDAWDALRGITNAHSYLDNGTIPMLMDLDGQA